MQDVKEILKSYIPAYNYAVKCCRKKDREWEALLKSPKMDGMPRNGSVSGLDDVYARIERISKKADKAREDALELCEKIYDMIDSLDDYTEKTVIKLRYIYGYTWGDIAISISDIKRHRDDDKPISERTVYYIHVKALANLRKLQ